jgi:hypothetical protein
MVNKSLFVHEIYFIYTDECLLHKLLLAVIIRYSHEYCPNIIGIASSGADADDVAWLLT